MAVMFEYKPGMSLTDPWPFTVVRASTAYRITKDGTLQQVAANVLRDNHYPFGLGSAIRTTLFEPTVINSCLQSQTLNTTWNKNLITITSDALAAPDGTVTGDKIVETATTGTHNLDQTITITAKEYVAFSGFFKAAERTSFRFRTNTNTTDELTGIVNLANGTFSAGPSGGGNAVFTGSRIIPLANGWYWVAIWGLTSSTSVSTSLNLAIILQNAGESYAGDGTSGIYAWGMQFERNGTGAPKGASSYVPTVAGTATRADEYAVTPWPYQMQAQWCYTSWYDVGSSIWLQSAPLVTITGSVANIDPTWCPMFLRNNGKPGASYGSGTVTPQNGLLGSSRNTIAPNAGLATVQPYDFVETFSRVLKDGSTWFDARINGGTIFTNGPVGPVGGIPFVDIVNPLLYLGRPLGLTGPQVGATCVRMGSDPLRITTLALAAAA